MTLLHDAVLTEVTGWYSADRWAVLKDSNGFTHMSAAVAGQTEGLDPAALGVWTPQGAGLPP